jgi:hypothetical protein
MAPDLTSTFAAHLARNQGPDPDSPDRRQVPDYGVLAGWEDGVVSVVLTFRCGSAYCCYEAGCHVAYHSREWWVWLREELTARGVDVPPRLRLHLEVVVEEGALFFDFSRPDPTRRGRYEFAPSNANRYEVDVDERANTD